VAPKIGFGERPYLLVGVPARALVAQAKTLSPLLSRGGWIARLNR
jgi:hypothetical protein